MKKIAVIRRNGLGDLLCAMPLITHLKASNPDCELTLFHDHRNKALLPYLRGIDHSVKLAKGNKYISIMKAAWASFATSFDLAVSTKVSPMKLNNIFLALLRAKEKVAVVDEQWHSRFVNKGQVFHESSSVQKHQALKCLQLVCPEMQKVPEKYYPKLHLADSLIQKHIWAFQRKIECLTGDGPLLLVSVSNNRVSGTLGPEAYADYVNTLAKSKAFRVVVSCEPKDISKAHELVGRLKQASVAIPTCSLEEFLVLLNCVDCVFVGHGGIMHMAAALDIPQVTLFAHTRLEEWHPLSTRARCLFHPVHVNHLPKDQIMDVLKEMLEEVTRSKMKNEVVCP